MEIRTMPFNLCWRKPNLPEGDLQLLVQGHASGVLRLTQAGYTDNGKVIDQTEYFRYQVFSGLLWYEIDGKEMAEATFHLQIKGTSVGTFKLKLSHKPSWEAGQNNYTTGLHWDDAKHLIQRRDLVGCDLELYKAIDENFDFLISIH